MPFSMHHELVWHLYALELILDGYALIFVVTRNECYVSIDGYTGTTDYECWKVVGNMWMDRSYAKYGYSNV